MTSCQNCDNEIRYGDGEWYHDLTSTECSKPDPGDDITDVEAGAILRKYGINPKELRNGFISHLGKKYAEACARIEELDAEIAALKAEDEWQPIESAPEMKTVILWANTTANGVQNWHMGTGFYHREMKAWIWEGEQVRDWAFPPSHWKPLPPAPDQKEGRA